MISLGTLVATGASVAFGASVAGANAGVCVGTGALVGDSGVEEGSPAPEQPAKTDTAISNAIYSLFRAGAHKPRGISWNWTKCPAYSSASKSQAKASMILVPLIRLLMPTDSSVPWFLFSMGSSSGWEPEKP